MIPFLGMIDSGNKVWAFFIVYAALLIFIGWLGKRASSGSDSMSDFYLNARSMKRKGCFKNLYRTKYF